MIATVTLNPSLDEWIELSSLRIGRLNRATGFARYPGGNGLNVSRLVHELGEATLAFGLAGGEDGLILRERINQLKLRHEFVNVNGLTRNNYKIGTATPKALTEINAAGPVVSSGQLRQLEHRLLRRTRSMRCLVLSGSIPPGAPATIYQRWIRLMHRRRIPTVLDASGAPLREGVKAHPWLIKPNRAEAEELLARRLTTFSETVRAAEHLRQTGIEIVILSLGREGAVMASTRPREVWVVRPPHVRSRSAVGAGDSVVGGFLVGWIQGHSLVEAFRLGMACGTATAMAPGTALCRRRDVRRLLPRITIRRVK